MIKKRDSENLSGKTPKDRDIVEIICQVGIGIFGSMTLVLIVIFQHDYGYITGMASQPFFLVSTYRNKQQAMFALAIVYTVVWIVGIVRNL